MKILAISDQRLSEMEKADYLRRNYADISLLFSCGDMEASYLEYINSILNVPMFFVRGNHDEHYEEGTPGGQNLHGVYRVYQGLALAGLEGSVHYNGLNVQHTEMAMTTHALRLLPRMMVRQRVKGWGADYLITHSPPKGIHDRPDQAHQGFAAFLWLMRLGKPRYLIHGHIDIWDNRETRETQYYSTRVININPKRVLFPETDDQDQ